MLLEQAEMQARFDAELKDARQRHETQGSEKQTKIDELTSANQTLLDGKRDMETEIKELANKLDRKEYEL